MDALTTQLMQQLSGGGLSQISQRIGADEETTGSALTTVMPLLVSALAKNATKPQEAESLQNALAQDHDGSILQNLGGFLNNPQAANGAGILKHVLGNKQPVVTQGLAQNTGLNSGHIGQLLQIAAPLLMGVLGQQQREQGLDTSGLSGFLGKQLQADEQDAPGLMSMVNGLLGASGSGSSLNGILGMARKLFGGH